MLTFGGEPTQIVYARRWFARLAMVLSILTLLCLLGYGVRNESYAGKDSKQQIE
jgi:hypothetical protein